MKTTLIAGLLSILPALAQSAVQVTPEGKLYLRDAVDQLIVGQVRKAQAKNAPYSADGSTETTQVLGDGNRIEQRTTQKLYRDSDGRERREESVLALGALAQPDGTRVITISDPVENVSYSLNPEARTARRSLGRIPAINWATPTATTAFGGYAITLFNGPEAPRPQPSTKGNVLKEDLGTKSMEGVMARGTRTTETIPAGQIGNLAPIKVVDEVWYSPDLQINIMTTHSDPRTGETMYKLTNIDRSNPPKSLFEPPADYKLIGPGTGARGGPVVDHPSEGRGGRGAGSPQK